MQLKEIRDHIQSIQNIKRVSNTIEKISMVRTRKFIKKYSEFKIYFNHLETVFLNFLGELKSRSNKEFKNLLSNNFYSRNPQNLKKSMVVNFFSNRGLCGAYNYHIYSKFEMFFENYSDKKNLKILNIGKKSIKYFKKNNIQYDKIIYLNEKLDYHEPEFNIFYNKLLASYERSKNIKIFSIYTDHSYLKDIKNDLLMPLSLESYKKELDKKNKIYHFQIDSNPSLMLNAFVKELLRSKLYIYYLKSMISENIMRHLSTKQATEKADEKIDEFKIKYNKLRQNKITQEIIEIISSAKVILNKK